jgi:hypothetical protein
MAEVDRRKAELIAELEVSRGEMRTAMRRLERSADVIERIRRHVGQNIGGWILGGFASGFVLARWVRPQRPIPHTVPAPPTTDSAPCLGTPSHPRSTSGSPHPGSRSDDASTPTEAQTPPPQRKSAAETPPRKSGSLWTSAAQLAFDLAKPKLMEWASVQLNELLARLLEQSLKPDRPRTQKPNPETFATRTGPPNSNP